MAFSYGVEHGNVLDFDADLVAFKYAQGFHGADEQAAAALTEVDAIDLKDLHLPVGAHRLVDTRGALRAPRALFIGTPSIARFDYEDARAFASRAVSLSGGVGPAVRRLGMTIHGVGFGMDELESLLAGLDGCDRAMAMLQAPELQSVTFVERDAGRVQRLRQELDDRLPIAPSGAGSTTDWGRTAGGSGWSVNVGTSPGDDPVTPLPPQLRSEPEAKPFLFAAIPFTDDGKNLFNYPIRNAAHACGYVCERIDREVYAGDVLAHIKKRIAGASIVVADLTGANANVFLEVGFAWAAGRPTILLQPEHETPEFDVSGQKQLRFRGDWAELQELLTRELQGLKAAVAA